MTDRKVMQQALEALEFDGFTPEDETHRYYTKKAITALKAALEQQQAEPICPECKAAVLYECVACSSNNYPPQQQAKMRMPKVGDKVICLEDESLGEVVSLTAGGSPDITFDDGSRGTYLLREFAELFSYAEQRQQQAEPVAWVFAPNNELLWPREVEVTNPIEIDSYYPLYTTPPQRQWVGLTDEDFCDQDHEWIAGASWAEAKLKEKNSDSGY